jgi:hypothetical protein
MARTIVTTSSEDWGMKTEEWIVRAAAGASFA